MRDNYFGRAGTASHDVGADYDLHVPALPGFRRLPGDLLEVHRIREELAGGLGPKFGEPRRRDDYSAGGGVHDTRDDGIVFLHAAVGSRHLVRPLDHIGVVPILDPAEVGFGVAGKTEPQLSGETEGPTVIKGSDENGGAILQIVYLGRDL